MTGENYTLVKKLETTDSKGRHIGVCLVADMPKLMEKYSRSAIIDLDNLFHITVNMPMAHTTDIPDDKSGFIPLCMLDLPQQWHYVKSKLADNLVNIYDWFEGDFILIPEKTKEGIIHFHCIARLSKFKIALDIPRMFWRMFDIGITSLNSSVAIKRFKDITKYMVHVEPIRDDGIINYLFHKDKKDYEDIIHIKRSNGSFQFQVMMLHTCILTKPPPGALNRSSE